MKRAVFTLLTTYFVCNKRGREDEIWLENVNDRPVAGPWHRCEEITSDHKKIKWETVEWIILVVSTDYRSALVNTLFNYILIKVQHDENYAF